VAISDRRLSHGPQRLVNCASLSKVGTSFEPKGQEKCHGTVHKSCKITIWRSTHRLHTGCFLQELAQQRQQENPLWPCQKQATPRTQQFQAGLAVETLSQKYAPASHRGPLFRVARGRKYHAAIRKRQQAWPLPGGWPPWPGAVWPCLCPSRWRPRSAPSWWASRRRCPARGGCPWGRPSPTLTPPHTPPAHPFG